MKSLLSICAVILFGFLSATAQVSSHAPASPSVAPPSVSDKPIAKVNSAVLTERDLVREMYSIFPYARVHGGFPKNQEAQIRKGALDMIVFEELVYQEAQRRKIVVAPATVTAGLKSYQKEFHSEGEYKAFLKNECNGSAQVLRERIKRSLMIDRLLNSEVETKSAVSDAELRAYYAKNANRFKVEEAFAIQTISILPPQKARPAAMSDLKKRADDAYSEAKNTKTYEQFGMLAEKLSDDDFRVNMGDHKLVPGTQLPPMVLKALAGMKPGQVSPVIPIENAFTVVRLNAHRPAGKETLQQARAKLMPELRKAKKQQLRSAFSNKLKSEAKVEVL